MQGSKGAKLGRMRRLVGVDRRTVERWRKWWRDRFTTSPFWRQAAAAFMPPVNLDRLPASLIERFIGSGRDRLIAVLRLLLPITGGNTVHAA